MTDPNRNLDRHNLEVLSNKNDSSLRKFIASVLPDEKKYNEVWDALYSTELIERTHMLLTELLMDIDSQLNMDSEGTVFHDETWRRRAKTFRRLIGMRLGRAKLVLKQTNLSAMRQVQLWQAAAHKLTEAIWEHEKELRSSPDAGPADRELWDALDKITRPDGASVRHWMENHVDTGVA